jgi:hypothetical protein
VNKSKFILMLFIAYVNLAFAVETKSNDIKTVSKFVVAFAQAAQKKDFSNISKILSGSDYKTLRRALDYANIVPNQKQTMSSLISKASSVVITPVYYENPEYRNYGNGYTVFFIISDSVSDVLLGKKTWLIDYAACDFFVKNSTVNQGPNICYFETEGPFYHQYGDL